MGLKTEEWNKLKTLIDEAKVVSFDMFDTLLFRKVNSPEIIFDIIGKKYGILGFRKLRMDIQDQASRDVYEKYGYPHADMNDIYEHMEKHTEYGVDWHDVKNYEIQLERDALVANKEIKDVYNYAKSIGKRVVVVSDMYLLADTLRLYLEDNGFDGFDHIYCSADEHVAKFNKLLYERVIEKEGIKYSELLHIGDSQSADVEIPNEYGINTYLYKPSAEIDKIASLDDSDIDKGIYKILYDDKKGFWYNVGVEVGGPIYLSLYEWLLSKTANKNIFFLARDGYNLYNIFLKNNHDNVKYLEVSRRSLLLAGITEIDDEALALLPPFTFGQTIAEIWNYLCIPLDKIKDINKAGFTGFDDTIDSVEDIIEFKKLYEYNRDVFLKRCEVERNNTMAYFEKMGYFSDANVFFDCGWQGTSQILLDRFNKAIDYDNAVEFYYYGIRNTEKSRKQLHGFKYHAYLFDFYKNYELQNCADEAIVLYELFFASPYESVYYYNTNGEVVYESGLGSGYQKDMLEGIIDYVDAAIPFKQKYGIETPKEQSVSHLQRLIRVPTEEEAVIIGNIENVDGFARKQGEHKYIANISDERLENNPNTEIYWINGLLNRGDIDEQLKIKCAKREGIEYPKKEESEYHLESEDSIREYHRWIRNQYEMKESNADLLYNPLFSIVIPVYNTVTEQLKECIESVINQTYNNYELILVDDHSSWDNVVPVLKGFESNEKIKVIYRDTNGHISVATNDAINASNGEYIVFMDCDDIIEPNALYEFAKLLNEHPEYDFIYSDEDKITDDGKIRHMPFFKPDWSPDLFLCMMYTNHLAAYRASIVKEIGGLRSAFNGSQDYDMTLRFMEKSDNIKVGHIAKVLYHWRERKESVAYAMGSKNYAAYASKAAKEDFITRNNIKAELEAIPGISQYRIVYKVADNPLVSIIIPSKDHYDILEQCIDSIYRNTDYDNFEIIVVDNGSTYVNKDKIGEYLREKKAKYIYDIYEFNFSKMCNIGRYNSNGEYLVFLNDDVEIIQSDWLERMLGQAQRSHVGAVGAKLLYPETTIIQHAGISNITEGPSHNFIGVDDRIQQYFAWNRLDYDCIAVTAACLMVSAEKFDLIGGFEEKLPIAYNDVSLCFSLYEKGYYNVIRDDVVAYHHESLSRGSDDYNVKKKIRLEIEAKMLYSRFSYLYKKDPFLNINMHNIVAGLDLINNYDKVFKVTIPTYSNKGSAVIDSINITDCVTIRGWSYVDLKGTNEERFLVFSDPYNNLYYARIMPVKRDDVVDRFDGDENYRYSGFECKISKDKLSLNIIPYKVGVCTKYVSGKYNIVWCKQIDIQGIESCKFFSDGKIVDDIFQVTYCRDVLWNIDESSDNGEYYYIRGYAFLDQDDFYNYNLTILLKGKDYCYEFKVYDEIRPDVAFAYLDKYFSVNTGFCCRILKNELLKDSYKMYLKFTNKYNNDNNYIFTNKEFMVF